MRIFVLTATYELRESRKSHLRDHPLGRLLYNTVRGWGRVREHERQPVLEAGVSVYSLGPRCTTQAQMHDLQMNILIFKFFIRQLCDGGGSGPDGGPV